MKLLNEFKTIKGNLSSRNLYFSDVRTLHRRKLDMEVFLPSRGFNLQRDFVWTLEQKRELIISILIERPIPNIAVMSVIDNSKTYNGIEDDILQIIDGKQRLCTIIEFYDNKFTLLDSDGKEYFYKDLSEIKQKKFRLFSIRCQIAYEDIGKPFSDEDKINWFRMINFTGTPQESDHMKKLLNKGEWIEYN